MIAPVKRSALSDSIIAGKLLRKAAPKILQKMQARTGKRLDDLAVFGTNQRCLRDASGDTSVASLPRARRQH
jgi:hypothetical protein